MERIGNMGSRNLNPSATFLFIEHVSPYYGASSNWAAKQKKTDDIRFL
jgi:hypothetical protein